MPQDHPDLSPAEVSEDPPTGEGFDDVIFENTNPPTQSRFLGAALRDYRPVSGLSTMTDASQPSRNSQALNTTYDPSSPFLTKDSENLGADSEPLQSFHVLESDQARNIDEVTKEELDAENENLRSESRPLTSPHRRRNIIIGCVAIISLIAIVLAILLGSILGTTGRQSNANKGAQLNSGGTAPVNSPTGKPGTKLWGVGGDTITTEDGSTFVYNNKLGGTWVSIPLNDTAKAQGDQPALNQKWDYSENRMIGVNLGGWLVIEPFIVPSLFEPYVDSATPAIDEWTLCQTLGSKAQDTIENHYKSFITEKDFADIASAGLNWIRLPVGSWMIETLGNEPFLEGVSFKYFLKAITWARKYGLRINLDLHAVPGSQNGWNHSGRWGTVGFLNGAMGIANAQRTLNYIRTLTEFISQPQYKNVVPMFSVLNEALVTTIGAGAIRSWYYQVYQMLRFIGGTGEGNGPFMVIHDGFSASTGWGGFLSGADRLGLDTHTYMCFGAQNVDSVAANSAKPCQQWATVANSTSTSFGLSMTGEFSLAINDCGLFVNNVGAGTRYEGTFPNAANPDPQFKRLGSCTQWLDDGLWTSEIKSAFADLTQTQQDVMRNSFFWTWKIGNSTKQANMPNPMWSYSNGLQKGYIRPDARLSNGRCAAVVAGQGGTYAPQVTPGQLASWQVGGQGAGQILPSEAQQYRQFPPATIAGAPGGGTYPAGSLPKYVATGTPVTLAPTPLSTGSSHLNFGSGWFQPADTSGSWVPQAGCQYPDPWKAVAVPAPTPVCGA